MLSPVDAQYFYESCHEVIRNTTTSDAQKLWDYKNISEELAITLCRNMENRRFFYHFYDRLNFIIEACRLPQIWHRHFNRLKYLFLKATSGQRISTEDWQDALFIITQWIKTCSGTPVPPKLQEQLKEHVLSPQLPSSHEHSSKVRLLVTKSPTPYNNTFWKVEGISPELGETSILIRDIPYSSPDGTRRYTFKLTETIKFVSPNQSIHLTQLIHSPEGWQTTDESLLIVEPDYLVDVSTIAQCYHRFSTLPLLALVNRFLNQPPSLAAFLGNLTNELFDLFISNPDIEENDAIRQVLDSKKTELVLLQRQLKEEEITEAHIYSELQRYFKNIKNIIPQYTSGKWHTLTEPHFYAPFYGLQGRIDLLLIDKKTPQHQNIIELKSGKPPSYHIWDNHLLQVSAYNLLLEDATPQRRGNSAVFYVRMDKEGLRDCGDLLYEKQLLLQIRNHIVFYERLLCRMTSDTMGRMLEQIRNSSLPNFLQEPIRNFIHTWQAASTLDQAYIAAHSAFLARELRTAKIGSFASNHTSKGFAALWQEPASSKTNDFNFAEGLMVKQWELATARLCLQSRQDKHNTVAFREGDIVLLYPEDYRDNPTGHPILRGMLDKVDAGQFVVKLRNRFVDPAIFKQRPYWCMESDWIETTFTPLFQSLGAFLQADARKKALIYGQERPRFAPLPQLSERFQELTSTQKAELQRALAAQDYYLLQGPPGTGKTSALLRKMAEYLYHYTTETIALIAFTNRATDEIALKLHQAEIPFVRLGMGSNEEKLIPYRLHQKEEDAHALLERLRHCRVWVSTVSSFARYKPLCGNIDTLIVDEASQLLEAHLCGLIAHCKRFILIGDEKQLPAVVMQETQEEDTNFEKQSKSKNKDKELLQENGLYPLHLSLFERLLYNAQQKGWTEAYGMLKEHFRCHEDIMHAFNTLFYKQLKAATSQQKTPLPATGHPIFDSGRLVFIPTDAEEQPKVHEQEATLTVRLIEDYLRLHPDCLPEDIGVIAPFRAQIAHIKSKLPTSLASHITIDTVERFQGSERRLIIMSAAVNHPRHLQSIEALDIHGTVDRKLNVAISRAKEQFILLGAASILCLSPFYKQLIESFCKRVPIDVFNK